MMYQIAAVARMTNLSVDVIRSWERRHKIVAPERDSAGLRLYDDNDVTRLNLARAATHLGHPIRRVAQMSNEELQKITSGDSGDYPANAAIVERVTSALRDCNAPLAQQILLSATLLLPVRELVLDVFAPLLREIGELWERHCLAVWQEHLVSTLIRTTAGALARSERSGKPMLFATPPFELHEFGILLASILASSHGIAAYNLGTNVPHDEIAKAALGLKPAVVVIGITQRNIPTGIALEYASALDRALAPSIEILLGGTLSTQIATALNSRRVRAVETLEEFDRICA